MTRIRYAHIFEQYYFGGRRALVAAPKGELTVHTFASEAEQWKADWLDGEPRLVLSLRASWRRSSITLSPTLREYEQQIRKLPVTAESLRAVGAVRQLGDLCRKAYGSDRRIHTLIDLKLYCTRRSLRTFCSNSIVQVTPANVNEVIDALVNDGAPDDPDYILKNGPAYVWHDSGLPVAFSGVHPSPMSDRVGNVMVTVKNPYRGQGIGKMLVSTVARDLLRSGRIPVYGCFEENVPSFRAALGAGFLFKGYGTRIFVADPE